LARAFQQDPLYVHAIPDESRRARLLPRHFAGLVRYGLLCGRVYTNPGLGGVAVWLGPGLSGTGLRQAWGLLKSGLWQSAFLFNWSELRRLVAFALFCERLHRKNMREAHWHLLVLGVDPAQQGQGIAHQLLQPVLQEADAWGLPCYLETTLQRNLPFYARYHFELLAEGQVTKGGPYCWAMRRSPASSRQPT
jgi:GNAT superfamily N-acetyltransferase